MSSQEPTPQELNQEPILHQNSGPFDQAQGQSESHRTTDQRYLERLEFQPQLKNMWLNFFVTNFRVVLLLIILLTAAGLYSFFSLPRESNPEVKIPIAVVSTAYPGASPADVEELVTKKLEAKIDELKAKYPNINSNFLLKEDLDPANQILEIQNNQQQHLW
jgi:hypothetical protein